MKTALQEFIDNVIPMHIIELDMIKQEIKKALIKEKEQIMKAVEDTRSNIVPRMFINENLNGENYYNQTYNN